jgi:hypothetical protein
LALQKNEQIRWLGGIARLLAEQRPVRRFRRFLFGPGALFFSTAPASGSLFFLVR